MKLHSQLADQRTYFQTGKTLPLETRKVALNRLKRQIIKKEEVLLKALKADLGKPRFEAFGAETGFLLREIDHTLRSIASWVRPQRVWVPVVFWPSRAQTFRQPKGQVAIFAPWNYPIQLALSPLVSALAAGNVVTLKPSELAPASSQLLLELLGEIFEPEHVLVVQGDATVAETLLEHQFDHIFFTGSTAVGRRVMERAAAHLTPVTLELGGKSPVIIDKTADLRVTAQRVMWGKFLNAGQTCVAPDYAIVEASVYEPLLQEMKQALVRFYGSSPEFSSDYGRIINVHHFDRLMGLLKTSNIVFGGAHKREQLFIGPTLVADPDVASPIMSEEIFGPILPLLKVDSIDSAFDIVERAPNPLAAYVFSKNSHFVERVIQNIPCGGITVNDTILHTGLPNLPFGGVRHSGMGRSRGFDGFCEFSICKSVLRRSFTGEVNFRYPPYRMKFDLLRRFLK